MGLCFTYEVSCIQTNVAICDNSRCWFIIPMKEHVVRCEPLSQSQQGGGTGDTPPPPLHHSGADTPPSSPQRRQTRPSPFSPPQRSRHAPHPLHSSEADTPPRFVSSHSTDAQLSASFATLSLLRGFNYGVNQLGGYLTHTFYFNCNHHHPQDKGFYYSRFNTLLVIFDAIRKERKNGSIRRSSGTLCPKASSSSAASSSSSPLP